MQWRRGTRKAPGHPGGSHSCLTSCRCLLEVTGSGERGVDSSETHVETDDRKAGASSRRVPGEMGRWLDAEWLEDGAQPFSLSSKQIWWSRTRDRQGSTDGFFVLPRFGLNELHVCIIHMAEWQLHTRFGPLHREAGKAWHGELSIPMRESPVTTGPV